MSDEAFEQAVRDYGSTVYRVACHAVGNRSDAEDVTQTVFLRLYQYRGEFDSREHLKHWLLRVAVNESRKLLRSPWRRRNISLEEWDGPGEDREESGVLSAVMALDAKYRLPIYLHYYEGLSVREVAQALRTKESTIQTRLQRAREKLRGALTDEEREGNKYVRPQIVP